MSKRDFYDVLGVSRDADDKALKSAYRKLAMQNHPDRNPDDEAAAERFREASEAYDILKEPQKRAAYDQLGHAAFENASAGAGGGFGSGGSVVVVLLIFLTRCFQNFLVAPVAVRGRTVQAMICGMTECLA